MPADVPANAPEPHSGLEIPMTDKHLSTQFDADLNAINTKLLQMGGLVESQIELAMRSLADFDSSLAD